MGHRCCSKQKVKRGLWSPEEDEKLIQHITTHGHGSWSSVPKLAGLQRCGKSCRLRWINYLRPDLKRGSFTAQEEQIIIDIHRILGNRWANIAKHLPGRTDNEVKNFWNSCIKKKLISKGLDPKTHNLMPSHRRGGSNYKKTISSISQSQHKPFSIITNNNNNNGTSQSHSHSHSHSHSLVKDINTSVAPSMQIINPPILTVPSSAAAAANHNNNNNNVVCGVSVNDSTNFVSSISSSSSSSIMNPSGCAAAFFDESCSFWVNNTNAYTNTNNYNVEAHLEASRFEGGMQLQQEQANHQMDIINNIACSDAQIHNVIHGAKGDVLDASFDTSTFDLEFVDSTLLSCREDLSSVDDLAWNFYN